MKILRNTTTALVTGATSLLLAPVAFAQVIPDPITTPSAGFESFGGLINQAIDIIFVVAGLAVLVYLFIGAFTYLTAGDSEDNVAKARKQITNAIVGLIILAAAFAMWKFIVNIIPGLNELLNIT